MLRFDGWMRFLVKRFKKQWKFLEHHNKNGNVDCNNNNKGMKIPRRQNDMLKQLKNVLNEDYLVTWKIVIFN